MLSVKECMYMPLVPEGLFLRVESLQHTSNRTFNDPAFNFSSNYLYIVTMVTINIAYTQAINPAGATPVLTRPQIWNGLQRKVRRAQDFVPVISGSKILEEHDNVVIREAYFNKEGEVVPGQEGKTIKETCKLFEPTKVCEMSSINREWYLAGH